MTIGLGAGASSAQPFLNQVEGVDVDGHGDAGVGAFGAEELRDGVVGGGTG